MKLGLIVSYAKADKVFNQYRKRFGVELEMPPLDYGHWHIDQVADCAGKAMRKGQPITDWGDYFAPLPAGADS